MRCHHLEHMVFSECLQIKSFYRSSPCQWIPLMLTEPPGVSDKKTLKLFEYTEWEQFRVCIVTIRHSFYCSYFFWHHTHCCSTKFSPDWSDVAFSSDTGAAVQCWFSKSQCWATPSILLDRNNLLWLGSALIWCGNLWTRWICLITSR